MRRSGGLAVLLLLTVGATGHLASPVGAAGTGGPYCKTLRQVRAADREFDTKLAARGLDALDDKTLGRVRTLFVRLADAAPRAVEDAARRIAAFSIAFIDAASGDDPGTAIDEFYNSTTPSESKKLRAAIRALNRFSRKRCGVPFSV